MGSSGLSVKTGAVGEIMKGRIICQAGRSPALADSRAGASNKEREGESRDVRSKGRTVATVEPGQEVSCANSGHGGIRLESQPMAWEDRWGVQR